MHSCNLWGPCGISEGMRPEQVALAVVRIWKSRAISVLGFTTCKKVLLSAQE